MKLTCTLDEVTRSYIPGIYIWDLTCGDVKIKMDIHRMVALFRKGDKIEVEISKDLPPFEKGKDFAAHGYVVTKRREDDVSKVLISLWGFLVILQTSNEELLREFNPMDRVYMVMRRST